VDDRDLDPRARGPVRLFVTRRSRTGTNDHRATSILARENRLVLAPVVVVDDLVVVVVSSSSSSSSRSTGALGLS